MEMTLDEAIKILTRGSPENDAATLEKWRRANDLGIEAMKRIKAERGKRSGWSVRALPGETKVEP